MRDLTNHTVHPLQGEQGFTDQFFGGTEENACFAMNRQIWRPVSSKAMLHTEI
jgi:hypothetical protein